MEWQEKHAKQAFAHGREKRLWKREISHYDADHIGRRMIGTKDKRS
jgi:hypothetical protein